MSKDEYSGLLFASPSALGGLARVMDIAGNFDEYNYAEDPAEADRLATASDWYAVGADIYHSILGFRTKIKAEPGADHGDRPTS